MSKLATPMRDIYAEDGRIDVVKLVSVMGESTARVAAVANMTSRAINKNPTSKRVQATAGPIAAVLQHALRTFGDKKDAMIWMRTPMVDLEGQAPLDVLFSGHASVVDALLTDIDTGQMG